MISVILSVALQHGTVGARLEVGSRQSTSAYNKFLFLEKFMGKQQPRTRKRWVTLGDVIAKTRKKVDLKTWKPRASNTVWQVVFGQQATREVKLHAIYCIKFLGIPGQIVAHLFGKDRSTIFRWLCRYEEEGDCIRRRVDFGSRVKLHPYHHEWVVEYVVNVDPLIFLPELRVKFCERFGFSVSESTLSRLLSNYRVTKKVIERRALQIRFSDIVRFTSEVNLLCPLFHQLLFLDEVTCDNQQFLRKKGWFIRNSTPILFDFFSRSFSRVSLLTFLGVGGVVENFLCPEPTFTTKSFFQCVRTLIHSGKIEKYPGRNSVWILDGASIHVNSCVIDLVHVRLCLQIQTLPFFFRFF